MKKLLLTLLLCNCAGAQLTDNKPIPGIQIDWVNPLSKGLVGVWLFNDNPGVTGRTNDLSGNNNHGTLVSDAFSTPALYGPGIELDGVDEGATGDHVVSTNVVGFDGVTGSVSIWFNLNTVAVTQYLFEIATPRVGIHIVTDLIRINTSGDEFQTGSFLVADQWYHIVLTWNSATSTRIIYMDGIEFDSDAGAWAPAAPTGVYRFGSRADGAGSFVNGTIDHVTIYNRDLNASEVRTLNADPFQMFEQERLPIVGGAAPAEVGQFIGIMSCASGLVLFIAFSFWISRRKTA